MNGTNNSSTTSVTDRYRSKRDKRIQNVKTGGDLIMYIGSAGLMIPMIQKAKENQNGIMGVCAGCAGALLSVGLGNVTSKILNRTIDKVIDFWDDVKPSGSAGDKKPEEEKSDG